MIRATTHQREQLLDALFYYLPMDVRGKIIRELPEAYNAYIAERNGTPPVVKVVRADGTPLDPHPDLLMPCRDCGYRALEHATLDGACPTDREEATTNAREYA